MILDIAKPSIISYLHYAHDLSIAETDARAREYLAVSFLHLVTIPDKLRENLLVDFCHKSENYPACPFLRNELLTGDAIRACGTSAVDKARALLDAGYYVRVDLNEFHISESRYYHVKGKDLARRPEWLRDLHFNLLYGYDEKERKFLTHGFNAQGLFTERAIPFDEFELAYFGDDVGMCRLRLLSGQECDARLYDRDRVVQCLTDFIESRCSYPALKPATRWTKIGDALRPHASILGLQMLGRSFGMATYDVAERMVARKNGKDIDIRPWCVMIDHKRSILRLCDYLMHDHGFDLPAGLLKQLEQISNDFVSLRNNILFSKMSGRNVASAWLNDQLRRLKDAERGAIGELIRTIQAAVPRTRDDAIAASAY